MIKLILVIFVLLNILVIGSSKVFADNQATNSSNLVASIKYEKVNPDNGMQYDFKRIKEKLFAVFAFSTAQKVNYQTEILEVRLAELKYIVDNEDIANIETGSQRYSATAGNLTKLVVDNNMPKEQVKLVLEQHLQILQELRKSFNDTTAEWRFIENDVNYLKIYLKELSQ